MRVLSFILCFVLCSSLSYGQKKIEKKKEIIIIKTDEKGDSINKEMIVKDLGEVEGLENFDALIDRLTKGKSDSVEVDVDVQVIEENGSTLRRITIKTNDNGEINVNEIVEEIEEIDSNMKGSGKTEKRIMIIDTEEEGISKDELMKKIEGMIDSDDVEILMNELNGNGKDSIQVHVDMTDEGKSGSSKVIVKTIKDGKEEITEIMGNGSDENSTFIWKMDGEDDILPKPTVSMGIMIANPAIVEEVVEGSAAENAGLKKGDKILKLDEQVIYSYNGLLEHLTSYSAGDKAIVTIDREGEIITKEIVFKAK